MVRSSMVFSCFRRWSGRFSNRYLLSEKQGTLWGRCDFSTSFSVNHSTHNNRFLTQRMEVGWITQLGMIKLPFGIPSYSTTVQGQIPNDCSRGAIISSELGNQTKHEDLSDDNLHIHKFQIGENVSKKDKIKFLVNTLSDLKDSKEAIYGALDAWVAWERNFPIASLKQVLLALEKEQQWHRVIQVIKWMLSKGQGNTLGTYRQLIRALDMDHRAEEAHNFWMKKIGTDLHSVPWQLCSLMISIYYRNNMLDRLVKLFKGLEAFDRKPPEKAIVQKVADAYEILGRPEEKERILDKYNHLFTETWKGKPKRSQKASQKKTRKSGERKNTDTSDNLKPAVDDLQAS
uniref:Pentatricopeptide repeat-containing protein At4g18975, chloroplastic n=1 Tax=Nelumbo nucifera TaxID=4432 RepID=A0A822YL76_NELNU|nr:TPA_asm: hypothetical protein HUJ06_010890 [Nelumbo nucifera]